MSVAEPVAPHYLWLVVVSCFGGFCFGFGTGANDVANAFATSVGSKTITLRQAMIIAGVFSFTGSLVLGRVSVSTISGGIADINFFRREPEILAYGMACAVSISGIWQIVASYFEYNVSATHSIIGSIIGFALTYGGNPAVRWIVPDPAAIPPYRGVVPIVISWFFAPIACGVCAAILFLLSRTLVLRRQNPHIKTCFVLPPALFLTVWVCIYFVFTRGAKRMLTTSSDDWTDSKAAWIAACVAAGVTVLGSGIGIPFMLFRVKQKFNQDGTQSEEAKAKDAEKAAEMEAAAKDSWANRTLPENATPLEKAKFYTMKALYAMDGTNVDVHAYYEEDELVAAIHANAEVFDPRAEYAFSYLQVFSAICVIFSHGAGEVGFFAGPISTCWQVYTEGRVSSSAIAPIWAIVIGGLGLLVGLGTYGYKVTAAMGVRLSKMSPTRGFCAELSTALVIMVASQYGLPTSSSQAITGAIIGVGLCEGKMGVNWDFFVKQFATWVLTLFIAGLGTSALFAQGLFAPNIFSGADVVYHENQISTLASGMLDQYRSTLESYRAAAIAGLIPGMTNATINSQSNILRSASTVVRNLAGTSVQTADAEDMWDYMRFALMVYQSDTILTIGQTTVRPAARLCNNNITAAIQNGTIVACPAPRLLPRGTNVSIAKRRYNSWSWVNGSAVVANTSAAGRHLF